MVVEQRRDNWSRDQVRSLRRKVRHLRAELKMQNSALREKKDRAEKMYRDLSSDHSRQCHHLARSQRGWERQLNRIVAENEWWREEIKSVIEVIEFNHPRMEGGYRISDVLFLLKWKLAHPMYPAPPTTSAADSPAREGR